MSPRGPEPPFACPACGGALSEQPDAYRCSPCGRDYPILFGIADFRLEGDLYLSLDDEREKAAKLHAFGQDHSFEQMVALYYAITDDVPAARAGAYAAYVHDGEARGGPVLDDLAPFGADAALLDLGCGSGGLVLAAARRGVATTGLDIALRWLVIARKRLQSAGVQARLVCADAGRPPFAPGGFSHVAAVDLVEHVPDPEAAIAAAAAQLRPEGRLWLSAANRYWPGPHPSVGLWAAGFWPKGLRSTLLRRLRGLDTLRNAVFVSPFAVARACRASGLKVLAARALAVDPQRLAARGRLPHLAGRVYAGLRSMPVVSRLLLAGGPAFQLLARKP